MNDCSSRALNDVAPNMPSLPPCPPCPETSRVADQDSPFLRPCEKDNDVAQGHRHPRVVYEEDRWGETVAQAEPQGRNER